MIHDVTGSGLIQCCGKVHSVLFFALITLRVMVAVDPARYIHVALQIHVVKDIYTEKDHAVPSQQCGSVNNSSENDVLGCADVVA